MKNIAIDSNILIELNTDRKRLQKIVNEVLAVVKRMNITYFTQINLYSI